jgi:hypothetical protein
MAELTSTQRTSTYGPSTHRASIGTGLASLLVLAGLAGCTEAPGNTTASDVAGIASEAAPTTVDGVVPLITGWALSVVVPGADIPVMVRTHAGRCMEAGPSLCRVEQAQATADQAQAYGSLRILADPQWLVGFRQGIETDVQAKGGKTEAESVTMENASGQIRAARDGVGATSPRTQARTDARRTLDDLQDRVALQTMQVTYGATPGLLSGAGGGAILGVWAAAGTLGGYGLALLLALVLLVGPVLLGLLGWRTWKRRASGGEHQASAMPLAARTEA